MRKFLAYLILAASLAGCQSSPTATESGNKPAPAPAPSTDSSNPPKAGEPDKPATDVASVPASLKHEGYVYYGLESGKDHDLEIRTSTNPTVYTGSQKAVLTGVKDGKATYSLERTGGLADMLGKSQDVVVDENGVQAVSIEGEKIEPAQTELPAQMTTGKTWTSKAKFTLKGQSFETDTVFKVVGPRKVKTKLGEFDSILVTSEGSNIVGGQKLMISAKAWYVKGMGEVRIEMTSKDEKGKEANVTVEAVK